MKRTACIAALVLLASGCSREADVVLFKNVTPESGLAGYVGMTHGAAWGDVDGDGKPDLYVSNHLNPALLFHNDGGGRFSDVTKQWLGTEVGGDKHGAAWADFDNDGRQDLVQLTGAVTGVGAEPKRLFHNLGDRLADEAAALGTVNAEHRARTPLWADVDGDGRLDLFQGAEARLDDKNTPFLLRQQQPAHFEADTTALALKTRGAPFCVLAGGARPQRLLCRLEGKAGAVQLFDLASLPAATLDALPQTAFEDAAVADFDHSGRFGIFLARRTAPAAVALGRPSERELVAGLEIDAHNAGQPLGLKFQASGPLRVTVKPTTPADGLKPADIHIGSSGASPGALSFDVAAGVGKAAPGAPGAAAGVWIGSSGSGEWELHFTASQQALQGQPKTRDVQVVISAPGGIGKVEAIGELRDEQAPARLFLPRDGKYEERADKSGVNQRLTAGASVVAGDFDNDMNVDLFVLGSGELGRQPNLLLLGDGKGGFRPVKAAGGADGGGPGVGDCVAMADFDGDGFLDLLVAGGASMGRSLGLASDGGGYRLYRNVAANGNHWIEIDLQGTRSNRDAIGAVVALSAGGVTQTRLQDGGQHNRCQNHARLHFGLAQNTRIDKISVRWPSGQVQEVSGTAIDRVLRIVEP